MGANITWRSVSTSWELALNPKIRPAYGKYFLPFIKPTCFKVLYLNRFRFLRSHIILLIIALVANGLTLWLLYKLHCLHVQDNAVVRGTSWRILHPNIIEVTVTWAGEASSILQTIHVSLCLRWTESLNDCLSLSHLSQPVWLQLTFHQHRKDHRFCKLDVGVIAFWLRSAPCEYSARRAGGLACFC